MKAQASKGKRIGRGILVGLLTALFLASSLAKLTGQEPIRESFELFGLTSMILVIGIGEMISALLYAVPRTSSLGTLLLSSHMGGAICMHMAHGEPYIFQSVVLILVWVGQFLRYPELLVSFRFGNAAKS